MEFELKEQILAVVALNEAQQRFIPGGTAAFFADSPEEQYALCNSLEKILKAMAHDLQNGVFILVRH